MKKFEFLIKFHWNMLLSIGSDNGLVPNRQQAIIWCNVGMLYWHIYASLSLSELRFLYFYFGSPQYLYYITISKPFSDLPLPHPGAVSGVRCCVWHPTSWFTGWPQGGAVVAGPWGQGSQSPWTGHHTPARHGPSVARWARILTYWGRDKMAAISLTTL